MADRVSQAMVEVLAQPASSNARVSQVMVEVLISVAPATPEGGTGRWFNDLWFEDEIWDEEDVTP